MLENISCMLCGADDPRPWGRENGFQAVKCKKCGLVYVNPRPKLETISEASRTGLHQTDAGDLNVETARSEVKFHHYGKIVAEAFADELKAPLSWLDVGSGYGELVEAVGKITQPGSRILGIDPMESKVAAAQARGVPISTQPLTENTEKYDVVSIINVFSHIPDFHEFGAELKKHINPGGYLFVETGNGGDLERRTDYPHKLDLPDHLVFIGVEQMKRLLTELGFDVVWVKVMPPSVKHRVKNLAKSLLAGRWEPVAVLNSPFRTVFYKAKLRAS